jgi:SAM-dependent methyltransferase
MKCLACGSDRLRRAEVVATSRISDVWARLQQHGPAFSADQVRAFVHHDVGADEVTFWECSDCRLQFSQPMVSWSAGHYPAEPHNLAFDHFEALAHLQTQTPRRLLDIGCADGQFLARVSALGHEAVGIDFAEDDVAFARQQGLNAHVADVQEVQKLIDGQKKFDLVTLFQVIEHLHKPDQVFRQISAVVQPDAQLMIGCPSDLRYSRLFPNSGRIQDSDFWDYPPEHCLRWNETSLRAFLGRHGWQVERVVYEPLPLKLAALHMTALDGLEHDWPRKSWQRGVRFAWWYGRLAAARIGRRISGVRIFVLARRAAPIPSSAAPAAASPAPARSGSQKVEPVPIIPVIH